MAEIIETDALDKDDILDELMKDDEPIDDKKEEIIDLSKPKEDDDKEEEVEEKEEKEEIEIKDDDDEVFEDIPKRQAILKEFPELFKKFPGIERAIYREQQYTELFPTISDAKEANARLNDFKTFENELFNGDIENILKAVKGSNDKAFGKITGTILQTLAKIDEKAYYNTLNHVIKNTLNTAFKTGKQSGDEEGEQLQIAARLLHKFIYGSTTISEPEEIKIDKPDEKETELTKREQTFIQQQLSNAVEDVTSRTDNLIKSTVDKYIDTKNVMTSYVKNKAIEDVMVNVRNSIRNDTRFRANLDKLWKQSAQDNFNSTSKDKIRNALISKAKTILPGIIQKVKAEALKGHATRTREASESKDEKPLPAGRMASSKSSGSLKDGKIPRGMSTLDFLNSD